MAPVRFFRDSFAVIICLSACRGLSVSSTKLNSCKSWNTTFTFVSHPLFLTCCPPTLPGLMSMAYAGVAHSRLNHLALWLELCSKSFIQIKFSSPLRMCCLHKLRLAFWSKKCLFGGWYVKIYTALVFWPFFTHQHFGAKISQPTDISNEREWSLNQGVYNLPDVRLSSVSQH